MTPAVANLHGAAVSPSADLDPAALLACLTSELDPLFEMMDWAEEEIAKAMAQHPDMADVLFHSFSLLNPRDIGPGMGTEFVYRGHVRELLQRVAAGQSTRPATAAEICLGFSEISKVSPMRQYANGLYFRMWLAAFPGHPVFDDPEAQQVHYERLYGSRIDDAEAMMRSKLADPQRQLGDITCRGLHHSDIATCRFAVTSS